MRSSIHFAMVQGGGGLGGQECPSAPANYSPYLLIPQYKPKMHISIWNIPIKMLAQNF